MAATAADPAQILYSGQAILEALTLSVALYKDRLVFTPSDTRKKAFTVFLEDVYGAEIRTEENHAKVAWVNNICAAARGISVEEQLVKISKGTIEAAVPSRDPLRRSVNRRPRRRLFVVVNPFGGAGHARRIYRTTVAPMLKRAGIDVDMVETNAAGHGMQLAAQMPLGKYDALVSVSGDGLLHELLNGLITRPDWREAGKTPLGVVNGPRLLIELLRRALILRMIGNGHSRAYIMPHRFFQIPAGSGNALAKTIDCEDPAAATFSIIRGDVRPWDLAAITQGDKLMYSFLSLTHALIADIDIGSEVFRLPSNWVKKELKASMFVAAKCGWLATDFQACPDADIGDGAIDLLTMEDNQTTHMVPLFLDLESGDMARAPFATYEKVHALFIDPVSRQGYMAVDGEKVPVEPAVMEILPAVARLIVPSDCHQGRSGIAGSSHASATTAD